VPRTWVQASSQKKKEREKGRGTRDADARRPMNGPLTQTIDNRLPSPAIQKGGEEKDRRFGLFPRKVVLRLVARKRRRRGGKGGVPWRSSAGESFQRRPSRSIFASRNGGEREKKEGKISALRGESQRHVGHGVKGEKGKGERERERRRRDREASSRSGRSRCELPAQGEKKGRKEGGLGGMRCWPLQSPVARAKSREGGKREGKKAALKNIMPEVRMRYEGMISKAGKKKV